MTTDTARERLLTYDEAAAWLGVSRRTLIKMVATGTIPHVRVERSVRFNPAHVLAALEKTSVPVSR